MTWPAANAAVDEGLEVAGVRRSFGPKRVLDGVDLSVAAGTVSAVLGPSGCGKTTLLRIVAGFLRPEAGTVRLCGRTLVDPARSVPPERRRVGIVPQEGALFPHLDVAGNVGFGLARAPDRAERVARWLDLVGLHDAEHARPHELSGGQQQRVALARALAAEPDLVLLDEPFSSLDAALRVQVREDVSRVLRDARCTAVIVTHDQQEALSLADQVAVLLNGRIAQADSPDDLYRAPISLAVATFVGDAVLLRGEMRDGVAQSALGKHVVVRPVPDGPATLVARPEQVVVDESGTRAHVIERRYYGADAIVRCRLDNGEIVVARTTGATAMEVDARTGLRVVGEVLAFAADRVSTGQATDRGS